MELNQFLSPFSFFVIVLCDAHFFRFEKLEIKCVIENLPVRNPTHVWMLCCPALSLTVSIQLSKYLSSISIIFWYISANIGTDSYWDCCSFCTDNFYCTCNCQLLVLCSSSVCHYQQKTPSSFRSLSLCVCLSHQQVTAHPGVQVTFLQTKRMTVVTAESFPHTCCLYFGLSDFI